MSVTVIPIGRLGNQIIRNIAASLLAQKHKFAVNYSSYEYISSLGIPLYMTNNIYTETIRIGDADYINILNSNEINYNISIDVAYCQTAEIIKVIYDYIRCDEVKYLVMQNNPYKERYQNNNDCFIHIRLGDIKGTYSLPMTYYLKTLDKIGIHNIDTIYISTNIESVNDEFLTTLFDKYPDKIKLIVEDEIITMQYASTCKYLLLSQGTFSSCIGYMAYFSQIYWPEMHKDKIWCGDLFIENNVDASWHKITYNEYFDENATNI